MEEFRRGVDELGKDGGQQQQKPDAEQGPERRSRRSRRGQAADSGTHEDRSAGNEGEEAGE